MKIYFRPNNSIMSFEDILIENIFRNNISLQEKIFIYVKLKRQSPRVSSMV